jgi:uncharacterized protein with NRDE domain
MCVAFLALNEHPDYELIIAANRDEFYNRPTKGSSFWSSPFGLLAGKDLQSGGTWFGIDRTGKWSLVTNYRDPSMHREDAASRGKLVLDYFYAGMLPEMSISVLWPRSGTNTIPLTFSLETWLRPAIFQGAMAKPNE